MMIARLTTTGAALALATGILSSPAPAQRAPVDARWQPWIGCWTPVRASESASRAVCVLPAAGASAADIVTIADGTVTERDRVDASGTRRARSAEGCAGWESAEWSADGRRLYRRAAGRCTGGIERTASEILSLTPTGEWLDVQGVATGGVGAATGIRVVRYRELTGVASLPAEIAAALRDRPAAAREARLAATAPLSTTDVADATRHADAPVVEAWLAERGDRFSVDAEQLVALDDAHVPSRVIDLLVALSYPTVFAVNPAAAAADFRVSERGDEDIATTRRQIPVYMDPYGYGDLWSFGNYYSPYGYSPYGYRYGYGSPYGYYANGSPLVIVVRGQGDAESRGRVVKGRGYTRDGASGTGEPSGGGTRSAGSSGSSGSAGSGASGSSDRGTGSSTGRTAKPRP